MPQMSFRAAWSLTLRKGGLGMRGIHSPGSTGKMWTCPPLPNSEAQGRGPVCRLTLVPSLLLWACPEPFPIILVLGGGGPRSSRK